mgnify:CR=1 FL=1
MAKIRTLEFLPEIFKTSTNAQFLGATLDQLVNEPKTETLQGYVGSKFGYGVNAKDYYVTEPNKTRTDYQLAPGTAFLNENQSTAKDFLTYPELIDALQLKGGVTLDNSRLFNSQFYSWDSFTDLDKLINFNQYYWIPEGPPAVTVASATVFSESDYIVTDTSNAYSIKALGASSGSLNPTLTLLRGGSYRFAVNQETQFWIQGVPGTTGLDGAQNTRDILGVNNNGANTGYVTFTVPSREAQNEFLFPGSNTVGVVSTKLFSEINGLTVSQVGNIDGVTSLEGLTVMFYQTEEPNEVGFVQSFFDEGGANYDVNLVSPEIVAPVTLAINETTTSQLKLSSGTTTDLVQNQTVTFTAVPSADPLLGGLDVDVIYYVKDIIDSTSFTISTTLNGATLALTATTGTMVANINEGLWEEGFYTNVNENFYTITYVGDASDPTIRLIPTSVIPTDEKITVDFGTTYIGLDFYRSQTGEILRVPYLSALLDTLYYQDGTNANKVGSIKLIESNLTNTVNVDIDIIGQKTFTSTNGVVFTNGLKVQFNGDIVPSSYLTGEYYVQGVGESINLISTIDLTVPEDFTGTNYIPYDSLPYSIGNFDTELFIPVNQDYITIGRNAINKNAWSRSNRWFHIDVINATADYNDDPTIVTTYATGNAKAKRPIIEFYPNLKLFDAGTIAKAPVDFIDTRTTNAFDQVANKKQYYPDIETYTGYTATLAGVTGTTTTVTIPTTDIYTKFDINMYVTDSNFALPNNTQVTGIEVVGTNTVLTLTFASTTVVGQTNVSIVGSDTTVNNYELFSGTRIVFTADTNLEVRNKIYVVGFSTITFGSAPVITLTEAEDGLCLVDDQTVALRGYNYQGSTFWFDGTAWEEAQQKLTVNQAPQFDIYDKNGISFGDATVYQGTSFLGNKLFAYGRGTGVNDAVLGFPLRYSAVDNVGDISFDCSLNVDSFSYVTGTTPVTSKVNTGYVYDYSTRTTKTRELGWQTAIAPSVQYQIFELEYTKGSIASFTCDVAVLPEDITVDSWPRIQVYVNNEYQLESTYTVTSTDKTTTVTFNTAPTADTPIQILVLSKQTSATAYYSIPINLSNNPFNIDLEIADIGDIRSQYQDIFINNPSSTGVIFGSNNLRDLGNLVPYGTKIIQNSAPVVLPSVFLRKSEHNLFDALQFNSNQYMQYKQQLIKTVNDIDWERIFEPSYILDTALEQMVSAKSEGDSFFWSDMLPSQAPYKSNTYTFANALQESIYPLAQMYDFTEANYKGVLVYLTRTTSGVTTTTQLIRDVDYTVSATAPSLTVTEDLVAGDVVTIKEYNQTYGNFVPNTPTKLGLYAKFKPAIVLDPNYQTPTYMLRGHDGSYTSLYTLDYTPASGLQDFRDKALLEFETRIYNNIKLSTIVPIEAYEVLPGFFRESTYSTEDYLRIYSSQFLNWAGQNRIDYKTQTGYTKANEFSWNYFQSGNKLTNTPIDQGYWRGVYEYFYGTSQPNIAPWEMLGFSEMPSWWTAQYGAAPYTSNNGVMWGDIEAGIIYNTGGTTSVIVEELKRPGLSKIIPVDDHGDLLSPFDALIGNYDANTFNRDWKVGDDAPAEFSYRRSSAYPYDLMRIFALTKPADFFNLSADLDNYKYNTEFKQYLVNDRSHLDISAIQIYGNGTAKTSYINWIVDFEKQQGVDATTEITTLLDNLDVRLIYRLAGFSDKKLLKFFVEKATPNSDNSSLLIPDESYSVLLHDNQPNDQLKFSSVIIQIVENGWKVFGNSQDQAYFTIDTPINNGKTTLIEVDEYTVKIADDYSTSQTNEQLVPYGTQFFTFQGLSQFLASYGAWLTRKGMVFDNIENAIEINWNIMIKEYLYWTQFNWEKGSLLTVNPSAQNLKIEKESDIVQPLTIQQSNFLLNQNLYPIAIKDLAIERLDTKFQVKTLNSGDVMAYGQFNLSNIEHGIVFDNNTVFNDIIYNLTTGLRQKRIYLRGTKTAEWNGTVNASGFILNQDNVYEWKTAYKYAKGEIVKYKNKFFTAIRTIEPAAKFEETNWVETDYNDIQKGLLPNSATRSYESTLYYNSNTANLEKDADQLSFSLIGFRPRDYLSSVNLSDITQVNVYKNLIQTKGTTNAVSAFKGTNLPTGSIDYDVYENWAILSGEFGGTLNSNFVDFRLDQAKLTGNPGTVSLTEGTPTIGAQQEVSVHNLFNYARPIDGPNILSTLTKEDPLSLYPTAGYVNYDDVKMAAYYYNDLGLRAVNSNGKQIPIKDFYVRDYMWIANFKEQWRVYSIKPVGRVVNVTPNTNNTTTITFSQRHGLSKLDPVSFINVAPNVNGYYLVTRINDLSSITINLSLEEQPTSLNGNGLGLSFVDQRVAQPADIADLDLNEAEFSKNTVWVDEASDGNWGVYQKSINYSLTKDLNRADGQTFGSAVAYTPRMGYLIGDSSAGKVYRYGYNTQTKAFDEDTGSLLTGASSFGTAIAYSKNLFVISEPETTADPFGTSTLRIYTLNDSVLSDDITLLQTFVSANGSGTSLAISEDQNYIFAGNPIDNNVDVYNRQRIPLTAGYFTVGQTYTITSVGTTDFKSIGAVDNLVGIVFNATGTGDVLTTGTADQITYEDIGQIDGTVSPVNAVAGDNFGFSVSCDASADCISIGAPNTKSPTTKTNWGKNYVYSRLVQNIESQYTAIPNQPQQYPLAWTTLFLSRTASDVTSSVITANASMTGYNNNDAVAFNEGGNYGNTGITPNKVYYLSDITGSTFKLKESRSSATTLTFLDDTVNFTILVQTQPLLVKVNGAFVDDNNYAVGGGQITGGLRYFGDIRAGDIINISSRNTQWVQTMVPDADDRVGVLMGYSSDMTSYGSEILMGAPGEIRIAGAKQTDGTVYRYTNGGGRYGNVIGTTDTALTADRKLLINGYLVELPSGYNATQCANLINQYGITNITASATDGKLVIAIINAGLALVNEKLKLQAPNTDTFTELGFNIYTKTQTVHAPHNVDRTLFGNTIKFNESDSVVISAPVSTRFLGTTFDFIDDENLDNDTIFDNNATRFVDTWDNAGAVYMYDYLANYNGSVADPGKFVYAQNLNSQDQNYGFEPQYGTALDFTDNQVVIGTPNLSYGDLEGQVTLFQNSGTAKDWVLYRQSAPIVDINRIQNSQIYSAETNNTLINLDYMDPMQEKLLGSVRENIDYVNSVDPANYNSEIGGINSGLTWGADQVGHIWFDTSKTRWLNYHQNDVTYNSRHWGQVFPGSDVTCYTWVKSTVAPVGYTGPGRTRANTQYSVEADLDASNTVTPCYYYWVRDTDIVNTDIDKTLSDRTLQQYITNPSRSGIAYFAPLLQNTFALYNSQSYINTTDSVFHIGFATGTNDDPAHQEFNLIKDGEPDDFLPGLPKFGPQTSTNRPEGLYDRLLDSLSGVDEVGEVVPNPYLPKAVQSGVLARPRQSFFFSRFLGLENYLEYANKILAEYPISETRQDATYLFASGTYYNTADYWSYVNWWLPTTNPVGQYNNNTKSTVSVAQYADLAKLTVDTKTIATVEANGDGKWEMYRYDGNDVWTRIGLENGTIQFNIYLWNYALGKTGFGDNFFDTDSFDEYPSEETRWIIRALNEQIYIDELVSFRNKSLIILFEYIQSETDESQNYLPWLNKTSLVDVSHVIRELKPIQNYQQDNQEFLAGYINEAKPYHVVIKDFLFKYTGIDTYQGNVTDFDLPAEWNETNQSYISPQLVYADVDGTNEFLPTNAIWQTAPYANWYNNYGLSLVGETNYHITDLNDYMTIGSIVAMVDNASGFPINGTIQIDKEIISYSFVDRALNILGGLQRGLNGTEPTTHLPGAQIIIDLPAVVILNGGKNYIEPPKITAYIDLAKYPAPRVEAQLEAVMSVDSVISVNVINPGEGYAVLPEVKVAPAEQLFFTNADINSTLHTIKLFAPSLQTGNLIQYKDDITSGETVTRLVDGQWYYINVLETVPTTVVALYTSYNDAINETNRVELSAGTTDGDFALNVGAKASAITSSSPTREINSAIRFDRTSYTSQILDWEANAFYGSFFAGSYFNSENVASSSITLQETQPPIADISASAQGAIFEIVNVANDNEVLYTTFKRQIELTNGTSNYIRLDPYDANNGQLNSSGSTIGFYVGMPIKFTGAIVGGIVDETVYYVDSVINITDFTIRATATGTTLSLTDGTVGAAGMFAYAGEVTDTAVVTLNYPGLLTATATEAVTNKITIPQSVIGTGGTDGFYIGIPLFFTGTMIGGIEENDVYYVTTVVDNKTITIGTTATPLTTTVSATTTGTNVITVADTTGFSVNDSVIFNTMVDASGNKLTSYGGIASGTVYYVNEIVSLTEMKIGVSVNVTPLALSTVTTGSALVTNQKDTLDLTTATGSMLMNVSLPVSPGQVDGQKFTMYNTSSYYTDITSGVLTKTLDRACYATIAGDAAEATNNRIALSDQDKGTFNFYTDMPIEFNSVPAGSGLSTSTTYFLFDFSVDGDKDTYIKVDCTSTSSSGNLITCVDTSSLWVNMPITFTGVGLGNIVVGTEYYIKTIDSGTTFTISEIAGSATAFTLSNDNGPMIGTGNPWIRLSTTKGGTQDVTLADTNTAFSLTQSPTTNAIFDIGYKLGGYRAILSNPGVGYAVTNVITISGSEVGGTSPNNDITLEVDEIDVDGSIVSLIVSGDPNDLTTNYYLKVASQTTLKVYSDARMTVPVSGIGFAFGGFTTTDVTDCTSGTDSITLTSVTGFALNDEVIFEGTIPTNTIDAITSTSYYIKTIDTGTNEVTISTNPGGSVVNVVTTVSLTGLTLSKAGSYAFLPEPFYFNQSIIKYLDRVYRCVISNNDEDFIIGKWEELRSDNRVLNALDRAEGYYQPSINMPGVDLNQLFNGTTYPNAVYLGNAFAPEDQFTIDTVLKDEPFYPTGVSITSVLWNGTSYLASANFDQYTGVIASIEGQSWSTKQISNQIVGATDVVYGGGLYVMTTTNTATPIYRSNDGITWTTNGWFTPYGALPYDSNPYSSTSLSIAAMALQSTAYRNEYYVSVGDDIVNSPDTYVWTERKTYDAQFAVTLYGVSSIDTSGFGGFIAVGKGKKLDYSTGVTELIDTNIIAYSYEPTGEFWQDGPSLTPNGLYGVTSNGTIAIAVGENDVKYQTDNGGDWSGINEVSVVSINEPANRLNVSSTDGFLDGDPIRVTNTFGGLTAGVTYYVDVQGATQLEIFTDAGLTSQVTLVDAVIPLDCRLYLYDADSDSLRDIIYADSIWMTVGDNGRIQTSTNGLRWTTQTSGTTQDLNGVSYAIETDTFVVVGDNNVILQSTDSGVTWTATGVFTVEAPVYDVKGSDFTEGYGPEELVPGLVKDNLNLTVVSRPGTVWDATEYSHTGFNVVSKIVEPTTEFQVDYSFDQYAQYPLDVSVQIIDATTELGTGLERSAYSINWITKVITLNTALTFAPKQSLRIDVYEVGNGNQLVKGCTDTDPIRPIVSTGFDDIYLNCNYSATFFQGSGAIRTGSHSIEVEATETIADGDTIVVINVKDFTANDPILFQGVVFGGIAEDFTYYVKSISTATNSITVSESYDSSTGLAGPIKSLTDATGSMLVNIQTGTGTVWTDPILYHNGARLVLGKTNTVSRTKASNNGITTGTTVGLSVGNRIQFAADMFGTDITPNIVYYIKTIVDNNEFTISATDGGTVITLTDQAGISSYVTNDYAIGIQPNGIQAKLVLAKPAGYVNGTDYLVYSVFGDSGDPSQYGYTVPEIQEFIGDGSTASFAMSNYNGAANPENAIVEVNGLRQTNTAYQINDGANTILFFAPPAIGAKISVLTYNNTERQYLTTQYGISGTSGSSFTTVTVTATTHTEGTFDEDTPSVETYDQDTPTIVSYDELLDTLTCADTSVLTVDEPIVFSNPTIGGITAGVTYYILQIIDSTTFTISLQVGGSPVTVTTDTGSMVGSSNAITVANITNIETGQEDPLRITQATATTATSNEITFDTTVGFAVDQQIYFQGTNFGGLVQGTVYFVASIVDATTATIKDQTGATVVLSTATGLLVTTCGGNPTTRITTGIPHSLATDQLVVLDGIYGSVELNGNSYYVRVFDQYRFEIYTQVYNPALDAVNYPVTGISTYISGGYVWRQGTFFLITTQATVTTASNSRITCNSTADLVVNNKVIFTQQGQVAGAAVLGGLTQGTTYYIKQILSNTEFTIGLTRNAGTAVTLTNDTGVMNVTQWEQTDVQRLWVTVNGYRLPTSKLRVGADNEVSILTDISPGDVVIMTNMIPNATPDEEIYLNFVDQNANQSIYRANVQARTWLAQPIFPLSQIIYVGDVTRVTDNIIQNVFAPSPINNIYSIGLTSDKNILSGVTVLNNTTGNTLDPDTYDVVVENLSPILKITDGAYISAGDSLKITSLEGNVLYINGEQIKFTTIDFTNNSVSGLQRGANGTGVQEYIGKFTEVYSILSNNRLSDLYISQSWNSYTFNTTNGDPLQISTTAPARFLQTDIT